MAAQCRRINIESWLNNVSCQLSAKSISIMKANGNGVINEIAQRNIINNIIYMASIISIIIISMAKQ
jgi:hypothetical protein